MTKPLPKSTSAAGGPIRAGEIYSLTEFCSRLGWGRKTLWHAERVGLRTVVFGRGKYILGTDAVAWFSRIADQQVGAAR